MDLVYVFSLFRNVAAPPPYEQASESIFPYQRHTVTQSQFWNFLDAISIFVMLASTVSSRFTVCACSQKLSVTTELEYHKAEQMDYNILVKSSFSGILVLCTIKCCIANCHIIVCYPDNWPTSNSMSIEY